MRLELTVRDGIEVFIGGTGTSVDYFNADTLMERESKSFAFFRKIDGSEEWSMLRRTVETELARLAVTTANWLPAAMVPSQEGFEKPIDIIIRIFPNSMSDDTPLSPMEEKRLAEMLDTLVKIQEETSE